MISLKVGSLTGLSSRFKPKRDESAKAEPVTPAAQKAKTPVRPPRRRAPTPGSSFRPKLVLASASPRRLQLLEQAGIAPDALRPASVDESVAKGEVPRHIVRRLARAKADTVVAVGRRVLGKAELEHEAADMLRLLRGRAHRVHTAVCLITPEGRRRERVVETRIRFRNISDQEIGAYLASGEWKGKAGGYAIQGIAGAFVVKLVGSYTNVVGLPLTEVVSLLAGEGYPVTLLWLSKAEVETE
jgi:septum formation protein